MSQKHTPQPLRYKDVGVDVAAGNSFVQRIAPLVKATRRTGADGTIGGFGGVFDLKATEYQDPLLVSGTDGVGTKIMIAIASGYHKTIGIDLVAMCVNDLVVQGAEPLYFLDYFATGHLDSDMAADIVGGIAQGCQMAGCALIGGETAEMPGMYADGHYDLAGFAVGAVERTSLLPRTQDMTDGDVLLGVASSGLHSNGFSLVRKIITQTGLDWHESCPFPSESPNGTVAEALLTPTRLYVKTGVHAARMDGVVGICHITGGGFEDNIPRILPDHLSAHIDVDTWTWPPVFQWLQETGPVSRAEMLRTFNCGIGLVLIVKQNAVSCVTQSLRDMQEHPIPIGHLVKRATTEPTGCYISGRDLNTLETQD